MPLWQCIASSVEHEGPLRNEPSKIDHATLVWRGTRMVIQTHMILLHRTA